MIKKYKIWLMSLILASIMGCSKQEVTQNKDYSRCSATSRNEMAEIESGFFYGYEDILYYADKDDMSVWVPVCNKPDCMHSSVDMECNAYIPFGEFIEKNGKLYGASPSVDGSHFVYEIEQDGSGLKHVYGIPFEKDVFIDTFRPMISQNQLVMYYGYLAEDGIYQYGLARLEDDTLHTLYSEEHESELPGAVHVLAKSVWINRGDDLILSSFLSATEWLNTLWRVDGDGLEQLILPEGVSPKFSYLSEDTFVYFQETEGFYKLNLASGEQELISECHSEDSIGYEMKSLL